MNLLEENVTILMNLHQEFKIMKSVDRTTIDVQ